MTIRTNQLTIDDVGSFFWLKTETCIKPICLSRFDNDGNPAYYFIENKTYVRNYLNPTSELERLNPRLLPYNQIAKYQSNRNLVYPLSYRDYSFNNKIHKVPIIVKCDTRNLTSSENLIPCKIMETLQHGFGKYDPYKVQPPNDYTEINIPWNTVYYAHSNNIFYNPLLEDYKEYHSNLSACSLEEELNLITSNTTW